MQSHDLPLGQQGAVDSVGTNSGGTGRAGSAGLVQVLTIKVGGKP